jgi:hypothetical protein
MIHGAPGAAKPRGAPAAGGYASAPPSRHARALGALRAARTARAAAGVLLSTALPAPAAWACADTWPFGNCYFNSFAGGLRGAQQRGWRSSTDYWAASYWQACEWLSQHAEPGAGVFVSVAWHVGDAVARLRLRSDLHLLSSPESPRYGYPDVLYVMYVTHRAFYGPATWALEEAPELVHEIRVQDAPILRIHRVDEPGEVRRLLDALVAGDVSALARLTELVPERLHRDASFMIKAPPRLWR